MFSSDQWCLFSKPINFALIKVPKNDKVFSDNFSKTTPTNTEKQTQKPEPNSIKNISKHSH